MTIKLAKLYHALRDFAGESTVQTHITHERSDQILIE